MSSNDSLATRGFQIINYNTVCGLSLHHSRAQHD